MLRILAKLLALYGRKIGQRHPQGNERRCPHPVAAMRPETILLAAGSMMDYIDGHPEITGSVKKKLMQLDKARRVLEDAEIGYRRSFSPIELAFESEGQFQALQPVFQELAETIGGVTREGRTVFAGNPRNVWESILCSVPNPGMYHVLENLEEAPEHVYCIHYGDMFIEDIADELSRLDRYPNLQSLTFFSNDMRENDLSDIPFEGLQQLRHLELSDNQLCDLWETICRLPNLESLVLYGNSLSRVWDYYGEMKNLKYLNVRRNCFNDEELGKLKKLLPHCFIEAGDQREW